MRQFRHFSQKKDGRTEVTHMLFSDKMSFLVDHGENGSMLNSIFLRLNRILTLGSPSTPVTHQTSRRKKIDLSRVYVHCVATLSRENRANSQGMGSPKKRQIYCSQQIRRT